MTGTQHHAICDRLGISAFHPAEWHPAQRSAYMVEKLALKRRFFHWLAGMEPRAYMNRAALIEAVRQDVREALKPPPASTYRVCPCHPQFTRPTGPMRREPRPTVEDVAAWQTRWPDVSPKVAAALGHIASFRGKP